MYFVLLLFFVKKQGQYVFEIRYRKKHKSKIQNSLHLLLTKNTPTQFPFLSVDLVSQSMFRNLKPVNGAVTPCFRTCKLAHSFYFGVFFNKPSLLDATQQKKTVHPPRRTFLHNKYNDILQQNRVVFIFQHNNLTVQEFTTLRQELGKLTAPSKLTVLRAGVFNSVLRETKFANLAPLMNGPTCVLSTNVEETALLKSAVETLAKNKKMLLLGGKMDNVLLNQQDVLKVVDLPTIDQLRSQVVGVIEAPARKLLSTLEQPANELHSVLDRRI